MSPSTRLVMAHWAHRKHAGMDFRPMAEYGLAGAGIGGIGSLLKSYLGKDKNTETDPAKKRRNAIRQALQSAALGGAAGVGLAGGAQMLGFQPPTLSGAVSSLGKPEKAPLSPLAQAVGAGVLGTAGTAGLIGLSRGRFRNLASARGAGLLDDMARAGTRETPSLFERVFRLPINAGGRRGGANEVRLQLNAPEMERLVRGGPLSINRHTAAQLRGTPVAPGRSWFAEVVEQLRRDRRAGWSPVEGHMNETRVPGWALGAAKPGKGEAAAGITRGTPLGDTEESIYRHLLGGRNTTKKPSFLERLRGHDQRSAGMERGRKMIDTNFEQVKKDLLAAGVPKTTVDNLTQAEAQRIADEIIGQTRQHGRSNVSGIERMIHDATTTDVERAGQKVPELDLGKATRLSLLGGGVTGGANMALGGLMGNQQ